MRPHRRAALEAMSPSANSVPESPDRARAICIARKPATQATSASRTTTSTRSHRRATASNRSPTPDSFTTTIISATPHESDDNTNRHGSSGVSQSGTAESDCRSKPVYVATASPSNTAAAGKTRPCLRWRLRLPAHDAKSATSTSTAAESSHAPAEMNVSRGLKNNSTARSVAPRSRARHKMPTTRSTATMAQAGTNNRAKHRYMPSTPWTSPAMPCEIIRSRDGTNSIVTPTTSSKPAPLPPRNKYQTGISPSIGVSLQQARPTYGSYSHRTI